MHLTSSRPKRGPKPIPREPCAQCGAPTLKARAKYCSRQCSAEARRGGSNGLAVADPLRHILDRVVPDDRYCWIWQQRLTDHGYGEVHLAVLGRTRLVHAVTYELMVGPVPAGLELDHLCRTRACCNPAHLEPVTHAENIRRGEAIERKLTFHRVQTRCPNGHEYNAANTHITKAGRRRCRACAADWARRNRASEVAQ